MSKRVPVSERAVLQRLNRHLKKDGEMVRKTRAGSRAYQDLGPYHAVDLSQNIVTRLNVDIEAWAREAGVLAAWETLVSD